MSRYVWWRWILREFAEMFSFDRNLENCKSVTYCNLCRWMDGMIWYDTVWYGMIWYDMQWYGMTCYDMIFYGIIWNVVGCVFFVLPRHVVISFFLCCGLRNGSAEIWNFQMMASHKSGCMRRMAGVRSGEWWDQPTSLQLVLFCRIMVSTYQPVFLCRIIFHCIMTMERRI